MHVVAATVRRHDQRIVPGTVKKRGQRVSLVVVVETCDDVGTKTAIALEGIDVQKDPDVSGLMPENLRHQLAPWPPAQISAVLLAQPFHAMQMTEIAGREHAAAVGDDIDIATCCASDRQHLIDCSVRMT